MELSVYYRLEHGEYRGTGKRVEPGIPLAGSLRKDVTGVVSAVWIIFP